jgi:hypothetical protein
MDEFAFNPVDGLNDHINGSVDDPVDPRGDIQKFLDQVKDHLNTKVKVEIEEIQSDIEALGGNQLALTLPVDNLGYTGITSTETMAADCAVGDVLYLSSTGYNKAKADADATLPCCAMCLETGTGSKKVLRVGFIKNTAWSFTVGAQVYVSTATAGAITATKPVTTGNRINPVGVAVAADTIWFNPTPVFVEVP